MAISRSTPAGYNDKTNLNPLLPLPDDQAVIKTALAQPQVVAASRRITTGGLVTDRKGAFGVSIVGIEPEKELPVSLLPQHVVSGKYLTASDQDVIFIGKGLADAMEVKVGDRITLAGRATHGQMRQRTMTVGGIYDVGMGDIEKAQYLHLPGRSPGPVRPARAIHRGDGFAETTRPGTGRDQRHEGQPARLRNGFVANQLPRLAVGHRNQGRGDERLRRDHPDYLRDRHPQPADDGGLRAHARDWPAGCPGDAAGPDFLLFILEGTMIGLVGVGAGVVLGVAFNFWLGRVGLDYSQFSSVSQYMALISGRIYPTLGLEKLAQRSLTALVICVLASFYPAHEAAQNEPAQSLHYV